MFIVKEKKIRVLYEDILSGDVPLEIRMSGDSPSGRSPYRFPISSQVKQLLDLMEETPEYTEEYSEVIIDELIEELKTTYRDYIKLTLY